MVMIWSSDVRYMCLFFVFCFFSALDCRLDVLGLGGRWEARDWVLGAWDGGLGWYACGGNVLVMRGKGNRVYFIKGEKNTLNLICLLTCLRKSSLSATTYSKTSAFPLVSTAVRGFTVTRTSCPLMGPMTPKLGFFRSNTGNACSPPSATGGNATSKRCSTRAIKV